MISKNKVSQELLYSPLLKIPEAGSLQAQLYKRIKRLILDGGIQQESRLPSTRQLALELGIARNTVIAVYNQLTVNGFITPGKKGAIVSSFPSIRSHLSHKLHPLAPRSRNGATVPSISDINLPFFSGIPSLTNFPLTTWRRTEEKIIEKTSRSILSYGDPSGEPKLREVIAKYYSLTRGVRCNPEQIIITTGFYSSVLLISRLILMKRDTVWIEDPGYWGANAVFRDLDMCIKPIPIDREGINPMDKDWDKSPPKVIYTTPCHQYPTGGVLSIDRRLELINKAIVNGAWIIEDDYGSSLRHKGKPVVSMQGIIENSPVIYMGTFSKSMYPSLRIGFVIIPKKLLSHIDPIVAALSNGGNRVSQLTLAEFIESGNYSRHMQKMRAFYHKRQVKLLSILEKNMNVPYEISGDEFGLQLLLRLPQTIPDIFVAAEAKKVGISLIPTSSLSNDSKTVVNGLMIGYGNTSPDLYESLIKKIIKIIKRLT